MKAKDSDFEIVFISSDKVESEFDEYYGEMPWLALPYENREQSNFFYRKFRAKSIPLLLILDKYGSVITKNGKISFSQYILSSTTPHIFRSTIPLISSCSGKRHPGISNYLCKYFKLPLMSF